MEFGNQLKELKGESGVPDAIKKAKDDFRYVLSRSNYTAPAQLEYQSICKGAATLGYALAVPFNIEQKMFTVPANLVKTDDPKMYVAAVCYKEGTPIDLLMFNSALFAKKAKPIKYDKKNGRYVLKIKDIKHASMEKFAFGFVIGNL